MTGTTRRCRIEREEQDRDDERETRARGGRAWHGDDLVAGRELQGRHRIGCAIIPDSDAEVDDTKDVALRLVFPS